MKLVWLTGDLQRARKAFLERKVGPVEAFDRQVQAIKDAGLPAALNAHVVEAYKPDGRFRDPEDLYRAVTTEDS